MRILAATTAIHPDRSSEGIASGRFLEALARGGHEVLVVTRDRVPVGWSLPTRCLPAEVSPEGEVGEGRRRGLLRRAGGHVSWLATGYLPPFWGRIRAWRREIGEALGSFPADLLVTRGAGGGMEPHLAVLGMPQRPFWLAHYHDPFPHSLHPEPYRGSGGMAARRQEAWGRRIVAEADLLSFPSARLRDWVLVGAGEGVSAQTVVLPHLLPEGVLPEPEPSGAYLTLAHTGTLLRPRAAGALVRGLCEFAATVPEARGRVRLLQVGKVHAVHREMPAWREWEAAGGLVVRDDRVPQAEALRIAASADVLVLLEADAASSPYFPVKLADYLALGRPILALSPVASVAADVLGAGYPLRVEPGSPEDVVRALRTIWDAWCRRGMQGLAPAASCREGLTGHVMVERLEEAYARSGRGVVRR